MDKDQEIDRLNKKIATMRSLLWEWNCSSGPVWEYWQLADVGETEEDYKHLFDDDSEEVA
jgi:hypothetical protein